MTHSRCLVVAPEMPDVAVLQEAAQVLRQGGVVAYPTDTVYGLAVDAMNVAAIERLYEVKQRPEVKAIPLIIGALEQLTDIAAVVPPQADRLIKAFWPGPLTLLFEPQTTLPTQLLGDSDRIGVRWPSAPISQQLAMVLGGAITATSANPSGAAAALTAQDVVEQLGLAVDLILDGGTATSPVVSTVLDVTARPPRQLRAGKLSQTAIEAVLEERIVKASSAGTASDVIER